jgi:hypothetical protein
VFFIGLRTAFKWSLHRLPRATNLKTVIPAQAGTHTTQKVPVMRAPGYCRWVMGPRLRGDDVFGGVKAAVDLQALQIFTL